MLAFRSNDFVGVLKYWPLSLRLFIGGECDDGELWLWWLFVGGSCGNRICWGRVFFISANLSTRCAWRGRISLDTSLSWTKSADSRTLTCSINKLCSWVTNWPSAKSSKSGAKKADAYFATPPLTAASITPCRLWVSFKTVEEEDWIFSEVDDDDSWLWWDSVSASWRNSVFLLAIISQACCIGEIFSAVKETTSNHLKMPGNEELVLYVVLSTHKV